MKKASRWFFVIPVLSLAIWGLWAKAQESDSDGDGLPDSWELRYALNPSDPADAALDADGDGLTNLAEYTAGTDPQRADTDRDGWSDSLDQVPLSRAFGDLAEGRFISGDLFSYPAPTWFEGAARDGGDWTTNGWAATTNAALLLDLDRALLTNDLALALVHTGAALHADLLDTNDTVLAENVLGDLPAGRAPTNVPFAAYPAAAALRLRAAGPLTLQSFALYRDDDLDGLDADQEAQLGTSDQNPDSDQDGFRDLYELQTDHDPLDAQDHPASGLTLLVPPDATVEYNGPTDPAATGQAQAYQNDGRPVAVTYADVVLDAASELPPRGSTLFPWLYEMTLAPNNQNLDNAGGDDWYDTAAPPVSGGVAQGGAGLFFRGDYTGSLWRLGLTNGNYTAEFSVNVQTNGAEGALGSLAFFGEKPADLNQGLRLNIKRQGQTVSNGSTVTQALGADDNTAGFHAFRVARIAAGRYELWRDGKRLTTAPVTGVNDGNNDAGFLGAFSTSLSGGWQLDWLRLTAGAYAPDRPTGRLIRRTWTATGTSSTTSAVQRILVRDTTPPVLTLPADCAVAFDASTAPTNTGMATAWDLYDPAPVVTHSDRDYRTGLEALLTLEESDGYFRSLAGTNRAFQGSAASVPGRIGSAAELDGAHALVSSANALPGVSAVSLWFRTTASAQAMLYSVEGAIFAYIQNGHLQPVFDGSSSGDPWWGSGLNNGQWHHLLAQNDGTNTVLYVDGTLLGSRTETPANLANWNRTSALGGQYDGQSFRFAGALDDVAFYSRTLSAAEIAALAGGSETVVLERTWTATDASGNAASAVQAIGRTEAQNDYDQDGLTNRDEELLGTDPKKADTDGDGTDDGVEARNGGNPLSDVQNVFVDFAEEATEVSAVRGDVVSGAAHFYYGSAASGSTIYLNGDASGCWGPDRIATGSGHTSGTEEYVTIWQPSAGKLEIIVDGYGPTDGQPTVISGSLTLTDGHFTSAPEETFRDNASGTMTPEGSRTIRWIITCNPYPNLPLESPNRGWMRWQVNYEPDVKLVGTSAVVEKSGVSPLAGKTVRFVGRFVPRDFHAPVAAYYENATDGLSYTTSPAEGVEADVHEVAIGYAPQSGEIPIRVVWTSSEYGEQQAYGKPIKVRWCESCAAGSCGDGLQVGVDSVNFGLPLGPGVDGQSAGTVTLRSDGPAAPLANLLRLETGSAGVVPLFENGALRQVLAPARIAQVVAESDTCVHLDLFRRTGAETRDANGVFACNPADRIQRSTLTLVSHTLSIVEDLGLAQRTYEYTWDTETGVWTLSKGNGLYRETLEHPTPTVGTAAERRLVRDANNVLVSDRLIETVPNAATNGTRIVRELDGGRETLRQYSGDLPVLETRSDGTWTRYRYDAQGRVAARIEPVGDAASDADESACRVTEYGYAAVDNSDTGDSLDTESPRTETEKVLGVVVGRTWRVYGADADGGRVDLVERAASPTAAYGDAGNERTVTRRMPDAPNAPFSGAVRAVEASDGRRTTVAHSLGVLNRAASDPAQWSFVIRSDGAYRRTETLETAAGSPDGIPGKTVRTVAIADAQSRVQFESVHADDGQPPSAGNRLSWTAYDYDASGRVTLRRSSDGGRYETGYYPCGIVRTTLDAAGLSVTNRIDALGQTLGRDGPVAHVDYTLDPLGRAWSERQWGGSLSLVTTNAYDLAGRQVWSRDPQDIETTTTYDDANRTVTSLRAGVTNEVVRYRDGRTKTVAVNGVLRATYAYGVEPDGRQWTCAYSGPGGANSPMWEKSWTDALGRAVRAERPGFGGTNLVSQSFYDAQGRLVRSTQTGQPDTLYAYNELGEPVAQAADLNGNGVMDLAGPDRVVSNDVVYAQTDGVWWRESRSYAYPETTAQLITTRRERLTGLGATGGLGLLASEAVSLDLLGNETVNRTWVDRAARKVTQVADTPDSTLDAIQTAVNGLVLTNATATGVVATYAYDALGRPVEARTDSDGGARSVRQTTQYNALGQVAWTEDGANHRTAFAYDAAGRQSAVTNALGQVTTTLYDALGNVTNVTGATYPVSYGYDAWNRMVWMKTYRDENGAGDLTQWQYDLATGLVTNKVYADGKGTTYTYTPDGKLARRTWARGIATDYGYTTSGELEAVDYSDATPDVTYTHDRLGRVVEAMTAGVCTNTYSYDVATLARSGETRRSIFGPTETLVRQQDVIGRPAGLTLGNDYAVGYGYDTVGRFGTVASTNTANAVTGQWTYERVPGSDLVAGWTAAAGNFWRRSYENNRDLIAETHSGYGATVLDSYAYTNDALGRRTARVDAGVTTNAFGYNLRSEVISAMMGSDQFGYGYDPIGNRLTATNNTAVTTYFANELNQYTNIVNGASAEPTYDDDGNMLAFGNGWTATWDGENRLVQLSKDGEQIGYAYDHQSRRIAKQTAAGVEVFSYDDWAMIRHTAPGGAKTDFIYGLDLSGTPQGAGTVGGLLGMTRAGDTAPICYGYDANGNVTLLADGSGTVAARYAYDPFGNTLTATGTLAAVNPFQFSTKYWENEAGLYYYGYRFYSPGMGRWVTRDPLGETGGRNLYCILENSSVIYTDSRGLVNLKLFKGFFYKLGTFILGAVLPDPRTDWIPVPYIGNFKDLNPGFWIKVGIIKRTKTCKLISSSRTAAWGGGYYISCYYGNCYEVTMRVYTISEDPRFVPGERFKYEKQKLNENVYLDIFEEPRALRCKKCEDPYTESEVADWYMNWS